MTAPSPTLDPTALLQTARILADAIPPERFDGVRASLEYLHHADREVTPAALRDIVRFDLSASDAEDIVFQLAVEGIMGDGAIHVAGLREAFIGAKLVAAQEPPPENILVATIPYGDRALDAEMFAPLHGNLLKLIRSAEDRLVLMSPFLSERAYERLRPALHTAAANGAYISLITNALTYGDDDFNRDCARSMLNDDRLRAQTSVYEYVDDETWTTFHAKIVIADDERAYLGTANLTHRGLGDNLELGVIFRDRTTDRFSVLVDALRESSFLYEVTRDDGRFVRV